MEDLITEDTLFDGDLIILQNNSGYRFSVDSVLLAHFVKVRGKDKILDLGCGCGVIAMIILYRHGAVVQEVSGIEIQPSLVKLARLNYAGNNFGQYGDIRQGDVKTILQLIASESYDKIVCNPPFYTSTSGRMNKNNEANIARHQVAGTLRDFLTASALAVKNRGEVSIIYPAKYMAECIITGHEVNLEAKRIQLIYSYPHEQKSAKLVLIQYIKNGGRGTENLIPFYVYSKKNGSFSHKMQNLYKGRANR